MVHWAVASEISVKDGSLLLSHESRLSSIALMRCIRNDCPKVAPPWPLSFLRRCCGDEPSGRCMIGEPDDPSPHRSSAGLPSPPPRMPVGLHRSRRSRLRVSSAFKMKARRT